MWIVVLMTMIHVVQSECSENKILMLYDHWILRRTLIDILLIVWIWNRSIDYYDEVMVVLDLIMVWIVVYHNLITYFHRLIRHIMVGRCLITLHRPIVVSIRLNSIEECLICISIELKDISWTHWSDWWIESDWIWTDYV